MPKDSRQYTTQIGFVPPFFKVTLKNVRNLIILKAQPNNWFRYVLFHISRPIPARPFSDSCESVSTGGHKALIFKPIQPNWFRSVNFPTGRIRATVAVSA